VFVGLPVLMVTFNEVLGWTPTVNIIDPWDAYELTPAEGGYRLDGEVRPFETETKALKVRQPDGSLREEELVVRRSVHGPVIALRVVGVDQVPAVGLLEQYWDMGRAQSLDQFEAVLRRLQIPMVTVVYADRDGRVLYLFNGQIPVRTRGGWEFWTGLVPGDTSELIWTEVHPYDDLPRLVDPPSGWVQNANEPPWTATLPIVLRPGNFPPYFAPP
jgi:acyl-homoserine-lactone acylase